MMLAIVIKCWYVGCVLDPWEFGLIEYIYVSVVSIVPSLIQGKLAYLCFAKLY